MANEGGVEEWVHLSEEKNNNDGSYCKTDEDKNQCNEDVSFIERAANHMCRHYNWIIVLLLTPISLTYDLYCFRKYFVIIFIPPFYLHFLISFN